MKGTNKLNKSFNHEFSDFANKIVIMEGAVVFCINPLEEFRSIYQVV